MTDARAGECPPLRLRLLDGAAAEVVGSDRTPGRVSSFVGSDPACWVRDAPTYATVTAREAPNWAALTGLSR